MIIAIAKIKLNAPWVHSLKEKRMIVKSIIDKVKHKFNVSIAEVENQDIHQTIVIGIAVVSSSSSHGDSVLQKVIDYIEKNCEANIEDIEIEIL
ncbi:DUF503 domain-containing protein [Clostridium sp. Marseille-QA1073]